MAALRDVLDRSQLPPAQQRFNWRADLPDAGVRMLGNDGCGNCCWASAFHFIELGASYTFDPLPSAPTVEECVGAYSAGTGYDPNIPGTDNGTVMMGPGGMIELWTKNGLMCGGRLNKLEAAVRVNFSDLDEVDAALAISPIFVGALISISDATGQDFMWDVDTYGAVAGGHEFLFVDREILRSSGKRYYDIMTWDGMWRCSEDWVRRAVDEMLIVLNPQWFDRHGVNPAAIDHAAVQQGMVNIASA